MKYLDLVPLQRINSFLDYVDAGEYVVYGDLEAYSCKLAGLDKKLSRSLDAEVRAEEGVGGALGASPSAASAAALNLSRSPVGPLSESSARRTLIYLILTLNHIYPDYDFSLLRAHHFRKEPSAAVAAEAVDERLRAAARAWAGTPGAGDTSFSEALWQAVDEAVDLKGCEVYSYSSDGFGLSAEEAAAAAAAAGPSSLAAADAAGLTPHAAAAIAGGSSVPRSGVAASLAPARASGGGSVLLGTGAADDDGGPFGEGGAALWAFNYFFYNRKLKRILYLSARAVAKAALDDEDEEDEEEDEDEDGAAALWGGGRRRRRRGRLGAGGRADSLDDSKALYNSDDDDDGGGGGGGLAPTSRRRDYGMANDLDLDDE